MPKLSWFAHGWYEALWRISAFIYYHRITVIHPERLSFRADKGPVLYVGLHRNGAVDGFIYHHVVPKAVFMISSQLRRSLLGRLIFAGIEVVRDKDRGREAVPQVNNSQALQQCIEHLSAGGQLFVFPEGSSDLGPKHLPFKRGAARLAQAYLQGKSDLTVVPLGVHYERAWAFRSKVEVVVGLPIDLSLSVADEQERSEILHARFTQALEEVGVNLKDAQEQQRTQQLAYAATLGTHHSYFAALKTFERGIPTAITQAFDALEQRSDQLRLLRHQNVPLVPITHAWVYVLALLPLGLVVCVAAALNAVPLLVAYLAGRKLADATNVVAMWRILLGFPILLMWVFLWIFISSAAYLTAYFVLSALGLLAYYRTKKLAVSVFNLWRGRPVRQDLLALHQLLDKAVRDGA